MSSAEGNALAVALGGLLVLSPVQLLIAVGCAVILIAITKMVSVGSVVGTIIATALVIYRNRGNIPLMLIAVVLPLLSSLLTSRISGELWRAARDGLKNRVGETAD